MTSEHDPAAEGMGPPARRSREDALREIKLALAIGDGLLLDHKGELTRGFDPYNSPLGREPREIWRIRRRG